MATANDYDVMVFDTYSPRADAQSRNYESWLAEVDSPLFNSLDMVSAYTCWKVVDAKGTRAHDRRGSDQPYTHFGFFGLQDDSGFDAMMSDPKALAHVPLWVADWSQKPDAEDMAENFFFSFARRVHHSLGQKTETVLLIPFAAGERGPGYKTWAPQSDQVTALVDSVRYESWVVEKQLQGDYAPDGLDIFFLENSEQAKVIWGLTPDVVLGALIAGPD